MIRKLWEETTYLTQYGPLAVRGGGLRSGSDVVWRNASKVSTNMHRSEVKISILDHLP